MHALFSRADTARYSVLRWKVLWLGSRAGAKRMENLRNAFDGCRWFEITGTSWLAGWIFPSRLPVRKRAARRVDQSDSSRCGAECARRNTDCLPFLFRSLCPQRKPLHAVLHGTDRPFPETDRVSFSLA